MVKRISGEIVRLYQPRCDRWGEHVQLNHENGEIIPLNGIGRVTVRLLRLNRRERVEERGLLIQAKVLAVAK